MNHKDIKNHLQEVNKSCQVLLANGNKRMLWRSGLDQPEAKLPKLFRFLQNSAFIVRLTEFKGEKVISEKEYSLKEFNQAIDDFLVGVDNRNKIIYF